MSDEKKSFSDPLEYLMDVLNDGTVETGRKDKIAIALIPYFVERKGGKDKGKKEQRKDAAEKAAGGRFSPAPPPKLVSSK
jgi:phage terminase small subunit